MVYWQKFLNTPICVIFQNCQVQRLTLKSRFIQLKRWESSCPLFDLVEFWSQWVGGGSRQGGMKSEFECSWKLSVIGPSHLAQVEVFEGGKESQRANILCVYLTSVIGRLLDLNPLRLILYFLPSWASVIFTKYEWFVKSRFNDFYLIISLIQIALQLLIRPFK